MDIRRITYIMGNIIGSTDFRIQHFSVKELMLRIKDEQLIYSRIQYKMWERSKQIQFIESVLCGIPIASLYFNGSRPKWTVLDGVERLCALYDFVNNEFPIYDLELLPKVYENKFFSDFPPAVRRRFLNTFVYGYVLTTELTDDVLNSIFRRLN